MELYKEQVKAMRNIKPLKGIFKGEGYEYSKVKVYTRLVYYSAIFVLISPPALLLIFFAFLGNLLWLVLNFIGNYIDSVLNHYYYSVRLLWSLLRTDVKNLKSFYKNPD